MLRSLTAVALVVCCAVATQALPRVHADDYTPRQVTATLGGTAQEFVVSWVSFEDAFPALRSLVKYGLSKDVLDNQVKTKPSVYVEDRCNTSRLMHRATIPLPAEHKAGEPVYFQVSSFACYTDSEGVEDCSRELELRLGDVWSPLFPFQPLDFASERPFSFALFGDMTDNSTISSVPQLTKDALAGAHDAVVHFGDIAYNLDDHCGQRGDQFMDAISKMATRVPYVAGVGNHEQDVKYSYDTFLKRFHGQQSLAVASNSPSVRYLSFDLPLVHIAMIDTDAWIYPPVFDFAAQQYAWLKADLARVNRTLTPYLIVIGHRAMYCTKNTDAECNAEALTLRNGRPTADDPTAREFALEPLLLESKTDLYFAGHTHHFEVTLPVAKGALTSHSFVNPTSPIHIQSGIAGVDGQDLFAVPEQPWDAFRDTQYRRGYGRITAFNDTHLHFQQLDARDGTAYYDFWLLKESV